MDRERPALYEQVAQRLVEQFEKGTSLLQKPWEDFQDFVAPYNPTSGKSYRGLNSVWLMMQGYEDPRWLTFKQAAANDWSVQRGSKGTLINYVKLHEERLVRDEKGNPLLDEQGNARKQWVKLDKPIITSAVVFNALQIQGMPERVPLESTECQWEDIRRAEQLVKSSGAKVRHGGNQAYYNPLTDSVTMPTKKQFSESARYYAVLLHELGHWTGHETRLDRQLGSKFGKEAYAKEELRAEIASLMLGSELKIGHDFGQHAAYVKNWISLLKNDPFELFRASADAQKIMDYLLALEQKRDLKPGQEVATEAVERLSVKATVEPSSAPVAEPRRNSDGKVSTMQSEPSNMMGNTNRIKR